MGLFSHAPMAYGGWELRNSGLVCDTFGMHQFTQQAARWIHFSKKIVVIVVALIYVPVTGQRQTLNIGRSAHFLLH